MASVGDVTNCLGQNVARAGVPFRAMHVVNVVTVGLGALLAWPIYSFGGRAAYDAKIDLLAKYDLGWAFLTALLVKQGWGLMNSLQADARSQVRVEPPDQHIYEVLDESGEGTSQYVAMVSNGALGQWNRAQRAAVNYLEYSVWLSVYAALTSFVFPKPVFALVAAYIGCRFKSGLGYMKATDGRMKFYFWSMIPLFTVEGLTLLTGVKAILRAPSA
eukprot:TRINITY_DN1254_c0_g1_i4.p1 TRINITY_DN1254_c0_g1~~TRINITY_DN1254_c0_g1_i4.p1  ORF type:complete len:217 (-),score=28.91 TRINITY_DN1254_c0_g1_i4:225-875(-)